MLLIWQAVAERDFAGLLQKLELTEVQSIIYWSMNKNKEMTETQWCVSCIYTYNIVSPFVSSQKMFITTLANAIIPVVSPTFTVDLQVIYR